MKEEQSGDKPKKSSAKPLGRGLGAILTDAPDRFALGANAVPTFATQNSSIDEIPVETIELNPFQPRQQFSAESIAELAESIQAQGIIQPITVRRLGANSYQLISGERRLQATKLIGLSTIPAYIRSANDEQMLEMALIENIQREELNPLEIAFAYNRLMEECSLTIEQVAVKVGKKRPTINNYIRLLKLPTEIQAGLRDAKISMGHARALISVDNPILQIDLYKEIVDKSLSVREVEELVRQIGTPKDKKVQAPKPAPTPFELQLQEIQRNLTSRYNTRINIRTGSEGTGEIRFRYYSPEDLERLLELLQS